MKIIKILIIILILALPLTAQEIQNAARQCELKKVKELIATDHKSVTQDGIKF